MDWKMYSERRRTSLKDFLRDCPTKEAALKRFQEKNIHTFPESDIDAIYAPAPVSDEQANVDETSVSKTLNTSLEKAQVSSKDKSGSGTTKS